MTIVIMAGGKGTRIASVNPQIPKPMLPLMGKPVLEYGLEIIRAQGYTEVYITVGYLKRVIMDYFGDGSRWGMRIHYIEEDSPMGTAGALYLLKDIVEEDILLVNGDILFNIDIHRMYEWHREHGGTATLLVHPNDHPYDSGLIVADSDGRVYSWLHKEETRGWCSNRVNAGIHIISSKIFSREYQIFDGLKKMDLDRDVLEPLIDKGELYAYYSPEYVKDMGTPKRLEQVERDLKSGKVSAGNLGKKQRAVFLDRDGTINRYAGFVRRAEELELLPGSAQAIRAINRSGYLAIIVTNQPVIARGETTVAQLQEIHNKLETLLGQEGAYVDAIYYCPHHPDKGYDGEVEKLKIVCNCRKPEPGLLYRAAEDYNIDLTDSWMVGDGERDVKAGIRAGCQTVYLGSKEDDYGQMYTFGSLTEFVERFLEAGTDGKVCG
ncbi:MAG: HAD-IIIA family hydrolase [Lachnospiraceae bacterium]|nr:HAD-IIIA family hydrolase [Lachnospiraceae bacterium]